MLRLRTFPAAAHIMLMCRLGRAHSPIVAIRSAALSDIRCRSGGRTPSNIESTIGDRRWDSGRVSTPQTFESNVAAHMGTENHEIAVKRRVRRLHSGVQL